MKIIPHPDQLPLFTLDKRCTKCGVAKMLDSFGTARTRRDGHTSRCKACLSHSGGAWQEQHQLRLFGVKRCSQCRAVKIFRAFPKNRKLPDGMQSYCSACQLAGLRARWAADPIAARAREQAHYQELYADPARVQARKERSRVRRQGRLDDSHQYMRRYYERNREHLRAYFNARHASKKANGGILTRREWLDLCARYGQRCLACGRNDVRLTLDHIIPVADGGRGDVGNIQPLCGPCNSIKGRRTIDYRPTPPA